MIIKRKRKQGIKYTQIVINIYCIKKRYLLILQNKKY